MQCALGYAWATEDCSGIPTVSPTAAPGSLTFAEAFAHGWDDFNAEKRGSMTNVRDAYRRWQDSKGAGIFEHQYTIMLSIPVKSMGAVTGYAAYRECRYCGDRVPASILTAA
jgi:hypothetical protein